MGQGAEEPSLLWLLEASDPGPPAHRAAFSCTKMPLAALLAGVAGLPSWVWAAPGVALLRHGAEYASLVAGSLVQESHGYRQ